MEEQELRDLIAETLDTVLPDEPDQTTRWARDFEDADDLEYWLRDQRCSEASIRRALEEYAIWQEKGTPKKFVIRGDLWRSRHVKVFGRRKRRSCPECGAGMSTERVGYDTEPETEWVCKHCEHREPGPF